MRIVIDLQACQSAGSRFRGIGRYSRSLAQAMENAGTEMVLFSSDFPHVEGGHCLGAELLSYRAEISSTTPASN